MNGNVLVVLLAAVMLTTAVILPADGIHGNPADATVVFGVS
jgi:hypothetical protein